MPEAPNHCAALELALCEAGNAANRRRALTGLLGRAARSTLCSDLLFLGSTALLVFLLGISCVRGLNCGVGRLIVLYTLVTLSRFHLSLAQPMSFPRTAPEL